MNNFIKVVGVKVYRMCVCIMVWFFKLTHKKKKKCRSFVNDASLIFRSTST